MAPQGSQNDIGCRISHEITKYTDKHNRTYRQIWKEKDLYNYDSILNIMKSSTEYKCVFKYLFSAALNCTFSFLRLLRLEGRLLHILILEQYILL
jgi:hypothetical protein